MSENVISADVDLVESVGSMDALVQRFQNMSTGAAVFSSFSTDDFDTRLNVISAVMNAEALSDHLGEPLTLRHYVGQVIEMPDEETGELRAVPRIILLCDEGDFYAISTGVMSALENITGIVGQPADWPAGKVVKVEGVRVKTRAGRLALTLKLLKAPSKK